MRFMDFLFPPRVDEVLLRETNEDDFLALLNPQLVPLTYPPTVALLPFSMPSVRGALHEAKYHGSRRAFRFLALALAEYLKDADFFASGTVVIVPVPLGRARQKERGFNQIEEVVRMAMKELGFFVDTKVITRKRETASQVSLPRDAREKNMRGAFGAAHSADPRVTYIIVDDTLTTGATLQAAIDALSLAGAKNLFPIALAH